MEKEEEKKVTDDRNDSVDVNEEAEPLEIVLFQVSECYVYLVSLPVIICVYDSNLVGLRLICKLLKKLRWQRIVIMF